MMIFGKVIKQYLNGEVMFFWIGPNAEIGFGDAYPYRKFTLCSVVQGVAYCFKVSFPGMTSYNDKFRF